MPDEVLIKDIVSRSDVNADKIFLLKTATEIYEAYGKLNTTLKGIGGGNIDTAKLKAAVGELNAAQKQLDASTRNLLDAKNRVAAADLKAEKIATQSAKTKLEEAKAEAVRTKSLIEQEKELTRLTEAEEKRAKKAALSNKAIGENYYALRDALAKANEAYRLFDKSTGDTVGFEKVKREAQEAKAKVDAFNRSLSPDGTLVGEYKTGILNFFKGIKGQIGQIAVGYIGLQALFQGGRKIIGLNFDFEDTANELRAITGVAGKDFDYLKDKAKETSTKTKFSAVEILESFKLIASAKPELLGNVEALNQVKDAAVILAQASGQTLPDAVDSLSKVLNQFGANASDSAKYIDALAAGAKFGAAEIPAITTALLEFGTQAKSSNISVQESIGLIELLAEKGIQGGEAGTKLRNILLSLNAVDALPKKAIDALQSYGVDLKKLSDTTLPLKDRIQELSKVQKDNSAIVQIFGKENFNAAQIVLQNVGRYDELAKQVTAVGVAQEQASVNTDSASTRFKILKNQLENLVTSKNVTAFLSGLASALSFLVGNLGIGIPLIITTVALTNTLAGSVIRVVVANGLLAAAYVVEKAQLIVNNGIKAAATTITNIYAAATIRSTAATGAAAIAYRVLALAIAFLSSPLGIVVGIIVAATTAFALFSGKTVEAVRSISAFGRGQEALNAINKRAQQGYIEQISSIDSLIAVLKDSSASADSKRIAMQKLIEINPKFRQALNGETIDLQKLALVYGDVTKAIYAKANADAAASLTAEKQQKVVAASTVRQRLEGQGAQVQNPNGIVSLRDISAAESAVLNETGIFKGVTVGENLDIAKNQLQPLIQAIKK